MVKQGRREERPSISSAYERRRRQLEVQLRGKVGCGEGPSESDERLSRVNYRTDKRQIGVNFMCGVGEQQCGEPSSNCTEHKITDITVKAYVRNGEA